MAMAGRRVNKVAMIAVVALIALLAIEFIARFFGTPVLTSDPHFADAREWSYPDRIARDAELLWRYRPNQVIRQPFLAPGDYTINAHGFRGADFHDEKEAGVMRVVCLGGSTTFGWGVEEDEAYPHQLEIKLNALDPERRRWEVINAGVTNYSTHQGLVLARRALARWKPDVVLFDFSWGDHQVAGLGIPDREIAMPPAWRLGVTNLILRSAVARYAWNFYRGDTAGASDSSLSPYTVWRVDPTSFVANGEKLIRAASDAGARPIWVTSPIAWPPPGQSDTSGIFHFHHRYHRAGVYAATLAGAEIAELANNFNLYQNLFDNPAADFEHFNAIGHNFAGDYLARVMLGMPPKMAAPERSKLQQKPGE